MNYQNKISDEEFIPFLHSLGVETYNKSFEWMLNDPDFADVLGWIYYNLDQNNALTAREEYRYIELEKQKKLLSPEELENMLRSLQDEFKGLCLPGDQDTLEDIKLDINMQKERLSMLKNHGEVLKELIEQNESTKEELNIELKKLNAAEEQATDDVKTAAEECMQLAKRVDSIINGVVDVVSDALDVYSSCAVDTELAKRFFAYGPFETYRQSQELFKSHFDLYTSIKFDAKHNDSTDEEMRMAVVEAKNMEKRLSDAIDAYIDTKADLSGEHAKLLLISNYDNVHSGQIGVCTMESQKSAIELLEQEESILEQQVDNAIKQFVEHRTALVVEHAVRAALADRELLLKEVSFLCGLCERAAAVDRLLYGALRHELQAAKQLLHSAAHLRSYLLQEQRAVSDRIKSMNDTCLEHELADTNLASSDVLLRSVFGVLEAEPADAALAVQLYNERRSDIRHLKEDIDDGYRTKEAALELIKNAAKPLHDFIWAGGTGQPACHHSGVSTLAHALAHAMAETDGKVVNITETFNAIKNGDKHKMRKLWQWFVADPAKMAAAIKYAGK